MLGTPLCQKLARILPGIAALMGVLGLLLLPLVGHADTANPTEAEIQEPNRPFNDLVDMSGRDATLAVGQGKWTLVMVWATDCPICQQQKPQISKFHDAYKDLNAEVVGIALDGRDALDAVQSYLDNHVVTFPNYVGELAILSENILRIAEEPLRGTPTYLLFDPKGNIKGINPGPLSEGAIERFIENNS